MKLPAPHFHLARVYDDGSRQMEIVPVLQSPMDISTHRRGFFGAGWTAASVLAAAGCAPTRPARPVLTDQRRPEAPASASDCGRRPATPDVQLDVSCNSARAHGAAVTHLLRSSDGSTLLSRDADGSIKLWRMPAGALQGSFRDPDLGIGPMALTPDGQRLAFCARSSRKTILLRDLASGSTKHRLEHAPFVQALAVSPDGHTLISGGGNTVRLWNLSDGTLRRSWATDHDHGLSVLAVSADGRQLASGGGARQLQLWNLPDGTLQRTLQGDDGAETLTELAFSADGRTLVSGHHSCLRVWSLSDGTRKHTIGHLARGGRGLAITPDSLTIVSGGRGEGPSGLRLWSLADGSAQAALLHAGLNDMVLAPDGSWVASAGDDQAIRIWNLPGGALRSCLIDLQVSPSSVQGVSYEWRNEYGQMVTFTQPCGTPIPTGAVCTCNCVPGSLVLPKPAPPKPSTSPGGRICTCVPVCVCMAVPVCQALHLRHDDPVVRAMAHEALLLMGRQEWPYLQWARGAAGRLTAAAVDGVIASIRRGAVSQFTRWPTMAQCLDRLTAGNEVVAIMAAQWAARRQRSCGEAVPADQRGRIDALLMAAVQQPWYLRHELPPNHQVRITGVPATGSRAMQ